jgi:chaperonin GroEL
VRSALQEGILPGGGLALYKYYNLYHKLSKDEKNAAKKTAYAVLASALRAPLAQILENAGLDEKLIYPTPKRNEGFDVKRQVYGNMLKMGIIDPMKVTKTALENAVSVAITILSTNAIVTMAREISTK